MGTHWEHIGTMRKMKNPLLHLHSLQTQKIHWGHFEPSHLAQVYSWKEDNICQSIWIKVRSYWEHIGNKRENETRIFLNNLPSRVLRKSVTCQHLFLPWSQCEGESPMARSFLTFIIWKRHSPLKVHMIVNKSLQCPLTRSPYHLQCCTPIISEWWVLTSRRIDNCPANERDKSH
jgi:hypothetical protein